jgi:hypothetical protein
MPTFEEVQKLVDENPPRRNVGHPKPKVEFVEGKICVIIPLTKGKWATVDVGDFIALAPFNWSLCAGYAHRRWHEQNRIIFMHRQIVGELEGFDVDHENRNTTDNRRCNLRVATRTQNNANRIATRSSGFKGVVSARSGRFEARIKVKGEVIYLGTFDEIESAARAYDTRAAAEWGEFAKLNLPNESRTARLELREKRA